MEAFQKCQGSHLTLAVMQGTEKTFALKVDFQRVQLQVKDGTMELKIDGKLLTRKVLLEDEKVCIADDVDWAFIHFVPNNHQMKLTASLGLESSFMIDSYNDEYQEFDLEIVPI